MSIVSPTGFELELLTEEPSGLAARMIADVLAHHDSELEAPVLVLIDTAPDGSQTPYVDITAAGMVAARALDPFATLADGRLLFVLVDPNGEPVTVRPDPMVGAPQLGPGTEGDELRAEIIDWIYLATQAMWSENPRMSRNFLSTYLRRARVERLSQLSTEDLRLVVDGVEGALTAHHTEFALPRPTLMSAASSGGV